MKRIIIIICAIYISFQSFAQGNIDSVILEVEKNNTSLIAIKEHIKAEKLGYKTDLFLNDPEVEFHYLRGAPSALGNRTDFGISQSFDFPTAYLHKKQMANMKGQQKEIEFKKELIEIKTQVRILCYDLIYYNALLSEIKVRLKHAESIAESYKIKFETGETNIIEFNKAQLNFTTQEQIYKSLSVEKESLLSDLIRLNGSKFIEFDDSIYSNNVIPEDFELWYNSTEENNPVLNWLKKEIEINRQNVKLNKAMNLPKFHAGYMSEKVADEQFRGMSFGMSIPIWESRNKTKYAKLKKAATESLQEDQKIQYYNELKKLHKKVTGLQVITNEFKESVRMYDNKIILKKALDAGEINLIEYLHELSFYYQSFNTLLESERNLNKTIAELLRYM